MLFAPTLALIAALATAPTAEAQTESRFALGANVMTGISTHVPDQDAAHAEVIPELLWRFGDVVPGWGPHWGLDWYSVDVDRPIGGTATDIGELHVRPILVGYGYTWLSDRNAISANILGGYAFGSIKLSDTAAGAYQTRLGLRATDADASNTLVFRPEIDIWHDLNNLFGLNVNIGYMIARPDVSITTSNGIEKRTARADQFQVRVGIVYSIF
jgi:hypothetical protein